MLEIGLILEWQFPGLANVGYKVGQDADGNPRISFWDETIMGRPKPTLAELQTWELPATKANRRRQIKILATADYDDVFALNGQQMNMFKDELLVSIAVERMGGPALGPVETQKKNQAGAIRAATRQKLAVINAATTLAEVQAVVWP